MAHTLFNRYCHPHAFEDALEGTYHDPIQQVPSGDVWNPPVRENSSALLGNDKVKEKSKHLKTKRKETNSSDQPPFTGDQTLAQSCRFMYDTTVSREMVYATADGDVGRVWEVMKVGRRTFSLDK